MSAISAVAEPIAVASEVNPRTFVYPVEGKRRALENDAQLFSGERVTTNRRGEAVLLFNDKTIISVGPNAELNLDDITMSTSTRATRFVVSTVKGSFRFVSGRSSKRAYQIRTPSATLGIRGTDFIIRISRNRTIVEVEDGKVNFCEGDNCVDVPAGFLVDQDCPRGSCETTIESNPNAGNPADLDADISTIITGSATSDDASDDDSSDDATKSTSSVSSSASSASTDSSSAVTSSGNSGNNGKGNSKSKGNSGNNGKGNSGNNGKGNSGNNGKGNSGNNGNGKGNSGNSNGKGNGKGN